MATGIGQRFLFQNKFVQTLMTAADEFKYCFLEKSKMKSNRKEYLFTSNKL